MRTILCLLVLGMVQRSAACCYKLSGTTDTIDMPLVFKPGLGMVVAKPGLQMIHGTPGKIKIGTTTTSKLLEYEMLVVTGMTGLYVPEQMPPPPVKSRSCSVICTEFNTMKLQHVCSPDTSGILYTTTEGRIQLTQGRTPPIKYGSIFGILDPIGRYKGHLSRVVWGLGREFATTCSFNKGLRHPDTVGHFLHNSNMQDLFSIRSVTPAKGLKLYFGKSAFFYFNIKEQNIHYVDYTVDSYGRYNIPLLGFNVGTASTDFINSVVWPHTKMIKMKTPVNVALMSGLPFSYLPTAAMQRFASDIHGFVCAGPWVKTTPTLKANRHSFKAVQGDGKVSAFRLLEYACAPKNAWYNKRVKIKFGFGMANNPSPAETPELYLNTWVEYVQDRLRLKVFEAQTVSAGSVPADTPVMPTGVLGSDFFLDNWVQIEGKMNVYKRVGFASPILTGPGTSKWKEWGSCVGCEVHGASLGSRTRFCEPDREGGMWCDGPSEQPCNCMEEGPVVVHGRNLRHE